jgi:hypothetical protein
MSALDIAPPMAPGQEAEKAGFFTKLFRKKESEPVMKEDLSTFGKEEFDLDDIRKKLGLHEELPKDDLQEMDVPEPPLPDAVPESMPVPHESDEPVHQAAPESPAPETPESVPETPESVLRRLSLFVRRLSLHLGLLLSLSLILNLNLRLNFLNWIVLEKRLILH